MPKRAPVNVAMLLELTLFTPTYRAWVQNKSVHSQRFNRPVVVTRHAAQRMLERAVDDETLLLIIDTGATRYSDDTRLWAWLGLPTRDDKLLCLALVLEGAVVVKTVMHHWDLMP